jgi:hypothetical protein
MGILIVVAILFIGLVANFNVWDWKRRSKMTPEERAAEDDAVNSEAWW